MESIYARTKDIAAFRADAGEKKTRPAQAKTVMTWISLNEAGAATGNTHRWLFKLISRGSITSRANGTGPNGKPLREILLESLSAEAQARYFESLQGEGSANSKASESLERGQCAESSAPQLSGLTEERLTDLNRVAEILGKAATDKKGASAKLGISVRSVNRKLREINRRGIAGLLRRKRNDAGISHVADNSVVARIQAEYLKPYRPSAADVHRLIARDYELSARRPPSYSFVYNVVQSIDPAVVARFRYGERKFDDKFAYISLRNKPAQPRQWVDADHHEIDHFVVFPDGSIGRPWLTALQDICTNEILGFNVPRDKKLGAGRHPSSESIGLALRHAILKKDDPGWQSLGLFENLYVDLGKDFRSQHIRAVCHDLHINIVHTRGYHGKSKPIERWFGILENGLRRLPGYCGRKPEENPARQNLKPAPLDPKDLLSVHDFEREMQRWIVAEFHHRQSPALNKLSPVGALEAHVGRGFSAREVRDERALDLLLMRRAGRMVRNFGIEAFSRVFMAPELLGLIGHQVDIAWDPAKLGEIFVYSNNRFVCRATNRELLDFGASEETLERERELKREQKRIVNDRYERLVKEAQYPDLMARAAAEERYDSVMESERKKIAANAQTETTTVLLPKYAGAAKALRAVKSEPEKRPTRSAARARVDDEELRSSEELFKRPEKPQWEIDIEREERACMECGADDATGRCWPCSKRLCVDCEFKKHRSCKRNPYLSKEDT